MMRRPAWLILFAACALDQDAAARAQSAAVPLETLLAKSLGPGSVAMLVEHAQKPAARERLVLALADQNPHTRAAAARVIFVQGIRELRPLIFKALETEMDRGTGRELLVAAAGLAPEQDIAALMLPTVNWDWVISGYRRSIASRMKRVVVAD